MGDNKMTTRIESFTWYELLSVSEGGLFVTEITSHLWGNERSVGFIYNPHTVDKPFRIIFRDCTVCHWTYYGSEGDEHDTVADVIGFEIGLDQHRKPAVLTTDLFEISIHYGSLEVVKDW